MKTLKPFLDIFKENPKTIKQLNNQAKRFFSMMISILIK